MKGGRKNLGRSLSWVRMHYQNGGVYVERPRRRRPRAGADVASGTVAETLDRVVPAGPP